MLCVAAVPTYPSFRNLLWTQRNSGDSVIYR
jgi:hypothetical protein